MIRTNSFEPLKFLSAILGKEKVPYASIPDREKMSLIGKFSLYIRANFFIPDARVGWNKFAIDRKSTRLNSSHIPLSRMPSSA